MSPVYEYKCPKCNKTKERLSKVKDKDNALHCMDCSNKIKYIEMKRVISKSQGKPVVKEYYSENLDMIITGPEHLKKVMKERGVSEAPAVKEMM